MLHLGDLQHYTPPGLAAQGSLFKDVNFLLHLFHLKRMSFTFTVGRGTIACGPNVVSNSIAQLLWDPKSVAFAGGTRSEGVGWRDGAI